MRSLPDLVAIFVTLGVKIGSLQDLVRKKDNCSTELLCELKIPIYRKQLGNVFVFTSFFSDRHAETKSSAEVPHYIKVRHCGLM